MRNSFKLSTLSVPAIVIIAAATSCFAQTQVTDKPAASPNTVTMTASEVSLALNRTKPVNVDRGVFSEVKAANESREMTKPASVTAANFNTNNSTSIDVNRFYVDDLKDSANLDGMTTRAGKSRVEFVPSRGQKLPDEN